MLAPLIRDKRLKQRAKALESHAGPLLEGTPHVHDLVALRDTGKIIVVHIEQMLLLEFVCACVSPQPASSEWDHACTQVGRTFSQ